MDIYKTDKSSQFGFYSHSIIQGTRERLLGKEFDLEIVEFNDIDHLIELSRTVALKGDSSVLPYKYAKIELQITGIRDLSPLAKYVLKDRVNAALELHDAFMLKYGLSLFDLQGIIKFRYNSNEIQTITPLVTERYTETTFSPPVQLDALVDGLHRCIVARRLGLHYVRTLSVQNVKVPLIALPSSWHDIIEYVESPPQHLKRSYRFQHLEDLSNLQGLTNVPITSSNLQYFFYRDLSILGSHGERKPHEYDDTRAH